MDAPNPAAPASLDLKAAERAALIERLKAQHPGIFSLPATVDGEEYEAFALVPVRAQYKRFTKTAENDREQAFYDLCVDCVKHPDATGLKAILDVRPGLSVTWGNALLKKAGLVGEIEAKKL